MALSALTLSVQSLPLSWVTTLSIFFAGSILGLIFYRLFLHPLAKFPGPKLAAVTTWYEFYYDAIKSGQYTFEIRRMHEKYGASIMVSGA